MRRIIAALIGLLLLVGCGGQSKKGGLSGTIKYKGQPVNGATLTLYPASGAGEGIPIIVAQDGTFSSTDIPAGDYKVVVEPSAGSAGTPSLKGVAADKQAEAQRKLQQAEGGSAPTIPFPDKYKQPTTTDLRITVAKGQQKQDLELKD